MILGLQNKIIKNLSWLKEYLNAVWSEAANNKNMQLHAICLNWTAGLYVFIIKTKLNSIQFKVGKKLWRCKAHIFILFCYSQDLVSGIPV